jgi:hypothetical protein
VKLTESVRTSSGFFEEERNVLLDSYLLGDNASELNTDDRGDEDDELAPWSALTGVTFKDSGVGGRTKLEPLACFDFRGVLVGTEIGAGLCADARRGLAFSSRLMFNATSASASMGEGNPGAILTVIPRQIYEAVTVPMRLRSQDRPANAKCGRVFATINPGLQSTTARCYHCYAICVRTQSATTPMQFMKLRSMIIANNKGRILKI